MARIRSIKPEFFTSLSIAALSVPARLHFIGLWTHVDDEGRAIDDPRLIKAAVWPLDDTMTLARVDKLTAELEASGRIHRYTVDNRHYLQVCGWEHQKIDRKGKSKYPASLDERSTIIRRGLDDASSPDLRIYGSTDQGSDLSLSSRGDDERATAATVDAVWNSWPSSRRAARDKVTRSITKALKAGTDHEQIVDGARRWTQHYADEATEDKYIPLLTTWLNEQRWLMDTPRPKRAMPNQPNISTGGQILMRAKAAQAQARQERGNVIDLPAIGSAT